MTKRFICIVLNHYNTSQVSITIPVLRLKTIEAEKDLVISHQSTQLVNARARILTRACLASKVKL